MTVFAPTYIGEPDIPVGLTISEYRCSRPRRRPWWRRIVPGTETGYSHAQNRTKGLH
jgi:hypothetical protein